MTRYEALQSEYDYLDIQEHNMAVEGLYGHGTIWIRKDLPQYKKTCILAEEIGHFETSVGDITDQKVLSNTIHEARARRWAYKKLVPLGKVSLAHSLGYCRPDEMAEYFGVDEAFLLECLKHYGLL